MVKAIKIVAFFFIGAVALLPISANAQCSKTWDASGQWEMRQGRTLITLNLKQSGSAFSGTATRDVRIGSKGLEGKAVGDADGNEFSMSILWPGGVFYAYKAKISPSGELEGGDVFNNGTKTGEKWNGEQPLTCGWSPGKSRGDLTGKPSANDTVKPGQGIGTRLAGPMLVAGPVYYSFPQNPIGQTTLQWDAGPDHPNAELWVKYNNSRERALVVKLPKGGQPVQVRRGLVYTYALMDGRTVLASVVVVGQ